MLLELQGRKGKLVQQVYKEPQARKAQQAQMAAKALQVHKELLVPPVQRGQSGRPAQKGQEALPERQVFLARLVLMVALVQQEPQDRLVCRA